MINLSYLKGKTVLVTGGTGTFGNALVSRLLEIKDIKKIIIFSRDELKQSQMQNRLKQYKTKLRFFIGDIRDLDRLNRAFEGVDIVVHAAALKQVPATEFNPFEAIRTNIIGSQNVIEAALNNNIKKTLLISSDKAVQPINLYGATKLCAE
ncbi:polysaccharide biosynthesis protein, partial [Patescibacteria group bacterium]|nr:polysaccharide biosynthesis protein [Patescibacteria group bacterium]